jgi:CBS domain-containing protein
VLTAAARCVTGVLAPVLAAPPSTHARTIGEIAVADVPSVHRDTSVDEALDAVLSTRLNRAVVVDDERTVLGILTDAELLRRFDRPDRTLLDRLMRRNVEAPAEAAGTAAEVSPVVTVRHAVPIADAIRRMLAEQHKLLPVVDDNGRLCGMVDRADALRAAFVLEEGMAPEPSETAIALRELAKMERLSGEARRRATRRS